MEQRSHNRLHMAVQQLETALRLYFEAPEDRYSVITLAGAVDVVLGQLLRAEGKQSQLDQIKANVLMISEALGTTLLKADGIADRANMARNALKHWSPDQPLEIVFDADEEAIDMLQRAVANYFYLTGELSPAMERFWIKVAGEEK